MNWLAEKYIKKYVHKNDLLLDIGCGIMQATTNIYDGKKSLKCKTILGVELVARYLDKVKYYYPTIRNDVKNTSVFADNSYDVVLCLDVLEHLAKADAIQLLHDMKRIARKYVLIYTPKEFDPNGDNIPNAWNMGENQLQQHKCLMDEGTLNELGFKTEITDIDHNIFGVFEK